MSLAPHADESIPGVASVRSLGFGSRNKPEESLFVCTLHIPPNIECLPGLHWIMMFSTPLMLRKVVDTFKSRWLMVAKAKPGNRVRFREGNSWGVSDPRIALTLLLALGLGNSRKA